VIWYKFYSTPYISADSWTVKMLDCNMQAFFALYIQRIRKLKVLMSKPLADLQPLYDYGNT